MVDQPKRGVILDAQGKPLSGPEIGVRVTQWEVEGQPLAPARDTRKEARADILSFGGGTQSHAIRELIRQERLPEPERIVMGDTGREAAETWEYLGWVEENRPLPSGKRVEIVRASEWATVDLLAKNGDLLMPVYTKNGEGQLPNYCSNEWKKRVIQRYLRSLGYGPSQPVRIWLGISVDELMRAGQSGTDWVENHFPLLFDIPMRRDECKSILAKAGYPEPPKSSCWMCPYRGNAQWRRLRDHFPADWAKAVALDVQLRETDANAFVHRSGVPLDQAVIDADPGQPSLFQTEECDSGWCFT